MGTTPGVLIVGGGIIGLTTAFELARTRHEVTLLDRGPFGKEASWAGAGILPPGNPSNAAPGFDRLRAESVSRFAEFTLRLTAETYCETGYRVCGGIEFLPPSPPAGEGLGVRGKDDPIPLWNSEQIQFEEVPSVLPNLRAYYFPEYAQVRNPWHLRALEEALWGRIVNLHPNCSVVEFVRRGSKITGVRTSTGELLEADQFVITAGAWAGELFKPLGIELPVVPVRGQIVLFNCSKTPFPEIRIQGKRYVVPRSDGRVLVGSTEEPDAGFLKATPPEAIEELKAFAFEIAPELRKAEIETVWCGLRPGTPDGMPYIGPVPGFENLFAAVGHFRSGIQLSLGTARIIRDFIEGQSPSIPSEAFRLDRLPDRSQRPAFRS